jgi:hypothetical protein
MKSFAILTGILLIANVIGSGCIGIGFSTGLGATDYSQASGSTRFASDSAPGAKYVRGDILQPDTTSDLYHPNVGIMIVGVDDDEYICLGMYRESDGGPWINASNTAHAGFTFAEVEETFPNKVGHNTVVLTPETENPTTRGPGKLQILSHDIEYDSYGLMYVVGTAKNVGGSRIPWATIEVKFYDHDGNVIGNSADFVQDLDPGEAWKFKAMYFDADGGVSSYKLGVQDSLY